MNKREFLSEINNHVKNLPEQERASLLEYFEEMICDRMENGEREEEIIASIGTPENILAMLEEEGIFGEREDVFHKVKGKIKIDEKVKIDITPISYKAVGSIHMIRIYAENRGVDVIPVDSDQIFVDFQPMEGIDEVERYEKDGEYVFHHRMKKNVSFIPANKKQGNGKKDYAVCAEDIFRKCYNSRRKFVGTGERNSWYYKFRCIYFKFIDRMW